MPSDVDVHVTDVAIIRALNTPGGAVYGWRNDTARMVVAVAIGTSPVNNPMNAMHRGGAVGEYKASWGWDPIGSNGHRVRATIGNHADHAQVVEYGRSPSAETQSFSWTQWGGDMRTVGRGGYAGWGTAGRPGGHILRRAVNSVMGGATGGTATPL